MTRLCPPTGLGVLELEVDRGVGLRFARAALRLVPVVAVLLRGVGVLPIFLMSFSERADRSLPGGCVGPGFGCGRSEGLLGGWHGITVSLIHNISQHVQFVLFLPDLTTIILFNFLSLFFL